MKNLRLKIAFPLVCVLLTVAFVAPVFAVDYNPGVSVGQWIKYGNYCGDHSSRVSNQPGLEYDGGNWSFRKGSHSAYNWSVHEWHCYSSI